MFGRHRKHRQSASSTSSSSSHKLFGYHDPAHPITPIKDSSGSSPISNSRPSSPPSLSSADQSHYKSITQLTPKQNAIIKSFEQSSSNSHSSKIDQAHPLSLRRDQTQNSRYITQADLTRRLHHHHHQHHPISRHYNTHETEMDNTTSSQKYPQTDNLDQEFHHSKSTYSSSSVKTNSSLSSNRSTRQDSTSSSFGTPSPHMLSKNHQDSSHSLTPSISIISNNSSRSSQELMPPPPLPNSRRRSSSLKSASLPFNRNLWPRADPNNDKFELLRPRDGFSEVVVNEMFDDMMQRRELASLPPSAKQDMLNFSLEKKWTLIYNDRYTEWHTARQKRLNSDSSPVKRTHLDPSPALGQSSSSSTGHNTSKHPKSSGHGMWRQSAASNSSRGKREEPEWYIKKFMDRTADHRVVAALAVALRTYEITWLQEFIHLKGQIVLTNSLEKINAPGIVRKEADLITEYETLKCLKILLNSKQGANDAISHPECVYRILFSLVSPHLPTRKTVADILTFLCHWEKPRGHSYVLKGLDQLATLRTASGKPIGETLARFDAWFSSFEQVIDGRGKMGSLVGASEELRSLRGHSHHHALFNQHNGYPDSPSNAISAIPPTNSAIGLEGALNEYALANLFLITSIISIPEDVTVRVHLRTQMNSSGLKRIMDKLKKFQHHSIERQLNQIEGEAIQDEEEMLENFNRRLLNDLTNPQQLFDAILENVDGSRCKEFLISILQHLLLIKEDTESQVRFYQLIDQLVTSVVLDSKALDDGGSGDFSSMLGVSVAAVMSRFADQDQLQVTMSDLQESRRMIDRLRRDKDLLEEELSANQDGKVKSLKETNEQMERALNISRTATDALQSRINEMEKQHRSEITQQELQIRELFTMLKESKNLEVVQDDAGILDRRELMEIMNKKLQREKAILTLEGRSSTLYNDESRGGKKRGRRKGPAQEDADGIDDNMRNEVDAIDRADDRYTPSHKPKDSVDRARFEDPDEEIWEVDVENRSRSLSPILEFSSRPSTRMASKKGHVRQHNKSGGEIDSEYSDSLSPSATGLTDIVGNYETYSDSQSTVRLPARSMVPSQMYRKPALYLGELKMHQLRSASGSTMKYVTTDEHGPHNDGKATGLNGLDSNFNTTLTNAGANSIHNLPPDLEILRLQKSTRRASNAALNQANLNDGTDIEVNDSQEPPLPPPSSSSSATIQPKSTPRANGLANPLAPTPAPPPPPPPPQPPSAPKPPPPMMKAPPVPGLMHPSKNRKELGIFASQKLKQLQWEKISKDSISKTVWASNFIDENRLLDMLREDGVFLEIEKDFKAKQAKAIGMKKKEALKSILDPRVRQRIEMILLKPGADLDMGTRVAIVIEKIRRFDEEFCTQTFLTELNGVIPDPTQVGLLNRHKTDSEDDLALLHAADRFLVELIKFDNLQLRVEGMLCRVMFDEAFSILDQNTNKFNAATQALKNAQHFSGLLNLILLLGNFLNGNNFQGGAFGFRVSSINRLVDTKATPSEDAGPAQLGDFTLLHFLEKTVSHSFPEVAGFLDELAEPANACRIDLLAIVKNFTELKQEIDKTRLALYNKFDLDNIGNDGYRQRMPKFIREAVNKLAILKDEITLAKTSYTDVLTYFGEETDERKQMNSMSFFGIFKTFVTSYRKARDENQRWSEARKARQKRLELEQSRKEAKEANDSDPVLEDILAKIRTGTPSRAPVRRGRAERERVTLNGNGDVGGAAAKMLALMKSGVDSAIFKDMAAEGFQIPDHSSIDATKARLKATIKDETPEKSQTEDEECKKEEPEEEKHDDNKQIGSTSTNDEDSKGDEENHENDS
ncbi:hypothetical protein O181_004303 [Austropuccinia psidii MF-1]|uniref:Uncharacterized protein n=1 Tax=Austropuccinia psidii MF-1 TaxID=1389203 RepID=A0A9Q3GEE7_9BASI|nr:hypothetical protein [Austropuccinia psidii MF-1]